MRKSDHWSSPDRWWTTQLVVPGLQLLNAPLLPKVVPQSIPYTQFKILYFLWCHHQCQSYCQSCTKKDNQWPIGNQLLFKWHWKLLLNEMNMIYLSPIQKLRHFILISKYTKMKNPDFCYFWGHMKALSAFFHQPKRPSSICEVGHSLTHWLTNWLTDPLPLKY